MSEWWTYRLVDFLMFSPATYWRLVEHYNRAAWPLHLVMAAAGVTLLWWVAARRPMAHRAVAGGLAAIWLWVGWAFHWQRYAQINWAAEYFAAAFVLQAVMLLTAAVTGKGSIAAPGDARVRAVGIALAATGLLLYPFAALVEGRPFTQAEAFGMMPEPTALATLGLLMSGGQRHRSWLCIVPVLSLLVGVATGWLLSG